MSSALTPVHRGQRLATDGSVALNWMTSMACNLNSYRPQIELIDSPGLCGQTVKEH